MFPSLVNIHPQSAVGKLLRLPLRLLPKQMIVPVLSGINKGNRWRVGASVHGCWLGVYETSKQHLLQSLVGPGMTIYDVGANAGFYTLAFSRLVGAGGKIYAFEPFAENAANILMHIRLNGCRNTVLYQAAVSDQEGFSSFHVSESNAMGHLDREGAYRVPTVTLDALIRTFDLPVPDIVKVDVEGAETAVLRGACNLLEMHRTVWLIALHSDRQRLNCGRILGEYGYRIYQLNGRELSAQEIDTDEIYAIPPQYVERMA
ncbi:MAG: FkbM family methyltransferase [Thermodesulfobacteriota bacterium]